MVISTAFGYIITKTYGSIWFIYTLEAAAGYMHNCDAYLVFQAVGLCIPDTMKHQ